MMSAVKTYSRFATCFLTFPPLLGCSSLQSPEDLKNQAASLAGDAQKKAQEVGQQASEGGQVSRR